MKYRRRKNETIVITGKKLTQDHSFNEEHGRNNLWRETLRC